MSDNNEGPIDYLAKMIMIAKLHKMSKMDLINGLCDYEAQLRSKSSRLVNIRTALLGQGYTIEQIDEMEVKS